MKKMTMALAAATLSLAAASTHADTSVSSNGAKHTTVDPNASFALSTSYTSQAGTASPNAVFTQTLDMESGVARPIGYFTITGLTEGYSYKIGEVSVTGADKNGVDKACFMTHAGNSSVVCAGSDAFLDAATSAGNAYVQIDHKAGPAAQGTTFVNIPVTAYSD